MSMIIAQINDRVWVIVVRLFIKGSNVFLKVYQIHKLGLWISSDWTPLKKKKKSSLRGCTVSSICKKIQDSNKGI